MKKKIFKAFNLGVSIMILTNLICSTGFAEESVIPVKAVKSYSNIHALPNSFGSRFEVVQETQTDYDISFVKKADFDQLTSDDKLKMKNSLRNDLNNKKSITFMGDADNLNIEALYEILGIKEQVIIEYEDEVAQNNLQYLTSISFFYSTDDQLNISYVYDETSDKTEKEEISTALRFVEENKSSDNYDAKIPSESVNTEILRTEAGSGNPPKIYYNRVHKNIDDYAIGEFIFEIAPQRVEVGDDFTIWQLNTYIMVTPYHETKKSETRSVGAYIYAYSDDDEWIERCMPTSTINSSSQSFGMSLAFTKDSVNRTYNVSQNYSITDITLLCDMRRQQNYCKYDYSYTLHSNVAKGSSDLEFKVLMSNKASLFFFKYDYNIAFNYADTFLFIDTWYYSEAKLGVVSVYYPDIKTGKK